MNHDIRSYLSLLENHRVLLLELNVINVEDIEKKLQGLLPRIEYEPARAWFLNAVRKYLINDPSSNARVTTISSNAPDWMRKAHEAGQPLYRFHATNDMMQKLGHLVDWLNSLHKTSQEKIDPSVKNAQARQRMVTLATKYLRGLNALDIRQLISPKQEKVSHHVEDWFRDLNALAEDVEDATGVETVIDYPTHYRWVSVKSEEALAREGKLMGHCVGGYYPNVKAGTTVIYSLRDPKNAPHCTIEISSNQIQQIKGKQNTPPTVKYVPFVQDFLNKMDIALGQGRYDLERTGLIYDEEQNKYGSMYELGEKLGQTSSDLEFVKYKGVIHLFFKGQNYGNIAVDQRNSEQLVATITVNNLHDDESTNKTLKKKVYDEAIKFLNSQYPDKVVTIGRWGSDNTYHYYSVNNQLVHISEMPVVAELPHSSVIENENQYWFLDKATRSQVLAKISKAMAPIPTARGIPETVTADVRDFLNQHKDQVPSNATQMLETYGLVYDGGEYKSYLDAATPVREWSGGGIYKFDNVWRMYDNGVIAVNWDAMNPSSRYGIAVSNPASASRHAQDLVEVWKESKYTPGRVNSDRLSELKKLGIMVVKGEWTLPKKAKGVDEKGYNILKITPKKSNIADGEGTKVGTLEYAGANSIVSVQIDNADAGAFLARYSAANPKIQFEDGVNRISAGMRGGSSSPNSKLWQSGFFAHDGKFVRIRDIYPTKKIIDSGKFTWMRRALVFLSSRPDGNRFVLNDVDNTPKLVLEHNDSKVVTGITPILNSKAQDYNEENVVPYLEDLNVLISALGLTVPGAFAARAGLEFREGKLAVPEASGKVRQFIDGRIMYEDGHAWIRSQYDKAAWKLVADIERPYGAILTCTVSDGDIKNITFSSSEFKKNKKLYREYMLDMMDVIDQL